MKILPIIISAALPQLFGCSATRHDDGPPDAVSKCADGAKQSRCAKTRSANIAMCYEPGEVGPAPWASDDSWPEFGCAAPPEQNINGGPSHSFWNWWCCAPNTCTPGEELSCKCSDGADGVRACRGDGLALGACICVAADGGFYF